MNILVTGGAGFIGSHTAERLAARGDNVVVIDELNDSYDPAIKQRNLDEITRSPRVSFTKGDIRDKDCLRKLFHENDFDVVVHLAARAGVRQSLEMPALYEQVNCMGAINILECARERGIKRIVIASSSSVYGNVKEIPFKESVRIDTPISPYAATKAACELYSHTYHHIYGMSITALRFFTVYGPRGRPEMAIYKFTSLIDRGEPIPFYGDGTSRRDYTFYSDIVDGIEASVDRDLGYEIINLGECQTTSLSEMVSMIEENLGKKAIINPLPMQPGDVMATCADISKAGRLLDYNPSVKVKEGIQRFVQWYLEQKSMGYISRG
ncbi:MAG: SDR family NAD(P)-dependent oxidoreductase [Verrucomicrobiota bacterium]